MKSFMRWLSEESEPREKRYFASWGLDDATMARMKEFYDQFLLNARKYGEVSKDGTCMPEHNLHVTVIYDKNPSKKARHPDKLLVGTLHSAPASHIEYWPGHDNSGYVVMRLHNTPVMQKFHDEHIKAGFKSDFWPYKPHMTLLNPANKPSEPLMRDMNNFLQGGDFKVNMHYQGKH